MVMPVRTAMTTHTAVGAVGEAPREGEGVMGGAASKVVVGARVDDDRATKRQVPTACPSVLPSECLR